MLRNLAIALFGAAICLTPATAQERPTDQGEGERPRRGQGPREQRGPLQMAERIAERLKLDETQRASYDQIVAKYQERFQGGDPRELMRQMREAREAGDDAKVNELREQMRASREAMGAAMEEFANEVATILTPEQLKTFDQMREDFRQRGPGGGDPRMMVETLRERLKLDPEQNTRFDELAAEMNKSGEGMRALFQQMRAAREAGDDAKVEELRGQLEAARESQAGAMDTFLAGLEEILNDEQKATLADMRQRMQRMRGGPEGRGEGRNADSVRMVQQALSKLDLSQDQRQGVRRLMADARGDERAPAGQRAERTTKLIADIKALLGGELAREFDKALEDARRAERANRRPARGEGAGRGEGRGEGAPRDAEQGGQKGGSGGAKKDGGE